MTNMEEKLAHIENHHQALILMINMVQSLAHTEKPPVDTISTIKMVQKQVVIAKHLPVTMNMINMVVKQEVIEQVQTESQPNTTNTEEKQVHSKKILQAELLNTINMAEKLAVINNV